MKTDNDGRSTTAVGCEQHEGFYTWNHKWRIQYDYRHTDGRLFSCVAIDLDKARAKRDKWLEGDR